MQIVQVTLHQLNFRKLLTSLVKALLIVLLNLESASLGKHKLLSSLKSSWSPMHLDGGGGGFGNEATFLTRVILHYDEELINQFIGTEKLVTFHSALPGDEHCKDHGFLCPLERVSIKDSLQPCWKTPYPVPSCNWTSAPVSDTCLHQ